MAETSGAMGIALPVIADRIIGEDKHRVLLPFDDSDPSASLKDLLDGHGVAVASECGGVGKCGFCLVSIVAGRLSALTPAEMATLSEDEIREGCRLACQARALGDLELTIVPVASQGPD
ncbi:MAG: 2Fe-2S iron-sulfur cluster-binding protein [Mariprofundus sp.]